MNASEIIKQLEQHCDEELKCSRRLRYQIESTLQNMINEHEKMKQNMRDIINGFDAYDSKTYTLRKRS